MATNKTSASAVPSTSTVISVLTTTYDWSDPSTEYLWETYHGKGALFGIIFFPALLFCLMLCSYFGNGLVVYSTYKNRSLRNAGNYFLCGTCVGDMMHQSSHWFYLSIMASGRDFIPQRTCFYFNILCQMGVSYSLASTFYVGIDRFLIVAFPSFYRRLNIKYYVIFCFLLVLPLALYIFYVALVSALGPTGNEPVMCLILDSFGGDSKSTWFTASVVFSAADVIIYSAVWYLLQKRAAKNDSIRKAFPSLVAIMLSVVLGWMVNGVLTLVLVPTRPVPEWYYWANGLGILPNSAGATNALVLYAFSQEYRATFRQILCGRKRDPSKVTITASIVPKSI